MVKRNIIGGIDPGNEGGICFMSLDHKFPTRLVSMPVDTIETKSATTKSGVTRRSEISLHRLLEIVAPYADSMLVMGIERVHSWRGQGVRSAFTFGEGYGALKCLMVCLNIPYNLIEPVRWKKAMMPDMGKDKGASVIRAQQIFPEITEQLYDMTGRKPKPMDGLADALLIAEYAKSILHKEAD